MDKKGTEFRDFLKKLVEKLASGKDLIDLQVRVEATKTKKKRVSIIFSFASPRTGMPPDDLGGGWINGYLEPGFFRRRRIFRFLLRTVKKGVVGLPFFIKDDHCGIRMIRFYEQRSYAMETSSLNVTIYFNSWRGIMEPVGEEPDGDYVAKDFDITLPDAEVLYA